LSTNSDQLEWRRSKVIELRSRGLSQIEIARELQVSEASISSDIQYLREQAKGTIKEYVTEHLPEQYQVCLCIRYNTQTYVCYAYNMLFDQGD
jgi:transcriptional regulator